MNDAHQRGFRSGYTQSGLIKKWVYAKRTDKEVGIRKAD